MHIYVYTLKCLREASNFVHTSEISPGLALLRLENLEAEKSLGENPEITLKEL